MALQDPAPNRFGSGGVLDGIAAYLEWLLNATGILCVIAMMFVVLQEVISRYVFNAPSTWSNEIASYLLIAVVFLGLAENLRSDVHIRIDVLLNLMSRKVFRWFQTFAYLVGIIFSILLAWAVWKNFLGFWGRGTISDSLLMTPLWIPMVPAVIGALVFVLSMITGLLRLWRQPC